MSHDADPEPRRAVCEPTRSGLEAPVRHDHRPCRDTPLVFAAAAGEVPDLGALAHRVARRLAAPQAPTEPAAGCFGARQRWYLTRLALPHPDGGAPRALVRSDRFIGADTLRRWRAAPPPEAVPLPQDVTAVVDGVTAPDHTAFFALLEGPAPWRSRPLAILPPPFETAGVVLALGDAAARLTDEALRRRALADEAAARDLWTAALAWLPADHPARRALGPPPGPEEAL